MIIKKKVISIALFFCLPVWCSAQYGIEDSLKLIIKNTTIDSVKFNALKELFYSYVNTHQIKKKEGIAKTVIAFGKEKNNIYYQGVGYRILADYYHDIGKQTASFENFLIALGLLEKTNKYNALVAAYTNLGNVYYEVQETKQAALYFKKGLSILEKHNIKDVEALTNLNNNLGICAATEGNKELAKFYFRSSLAFWIQQKDSLSMGYGYNNLGLLAMNSQQYDTALYYYKKALAFKLKFSSKDRILEAYSALGALYDNMKRNDLAIESFKYAENYVDTMSGSKYVRNLYSNMSETYAQEKKFKEALIYQKKYAAILNERVEENETTEFNKAEKAYNDSLINESEKQIQKLQIQNQNTQMESDKQQKIFLMIGLTIVLIGGILFYNRYKITKKQKDIIEKQKYLVEEQNSEIVHQKELIEEKQKEIIDSITYANKIQNAVLTNDSVWQKISPQHFVLFKPKDIVSGDFYWAYETSSNKSIWAVADCTGHGVPGAFMSMLGNSLLNEIVIENKIHKASEILNRLRSKIILALSKENVSSNDGMDISLCIWDKSNNTLEFAGANNHAVIVRDNAIQEIKGDKMPVGNYHGEEKPFTSSEFKLQKNDIIYLYTDGYADQFGGLKGKKFRYKQLDELLLANHAQDMSLQAKLLEQTFLTWKGGLVQTDDICIVGIKVLT